MKLCRLLTLCSTALLVLAASTLSPTATAQEQKNANLVQRINVSKADAQAAQKIVASAFHAIPASVPGAMEKVAKLNATGARGAALLKLDPSLTASSQPIPQVQSSGLLFYPADLVYFGGPLLTDATSHNIYVNTEPSAITSTWGNPEGFLSDLGNSSFIHLTDQYTYDFNPGVRYPVDHNKYILGASGYGVMTDTDMQFFAYIFARQTSQSGLNHIFHIFLPPGQDVCFDDSDSSCYSPDNYSTWSFCAYHGAFTASDIGTILYTVEPFQDVPGCAVQTPSPNGQLADSTNSVLSHETFETITDPLPGTGWINWTSLDLYGYEVGDECQALGNQYGDALDPTFKISGKLYEVQLEYSNRYHACAMQP